MTTEVELKVMKGSHDTKGKWLVVAGHYHHRRFAKRRPRWTVDRYISEHDSPETAEAALAKLKCRPA